MVLIWSSGRECEVDTLPSFALCWGTQRSKVFHVFSSWRAPWMGLFCTLGCSRQFTFPIFFRLEEHLEFFVLKGIICYFKKYAVTWLPFRGSYVQLYLLCYLFGIIFIFWYKSRGSSNSTLMYFSDYRELVSKEIPEIAVNGHCLNLV